MADEAITLEKADSIGVKHEYTDLTVEEISVVDRPANKKEFAVIKRVKSDAQQMEDPTMADSKEVEKKTTDDVADVERVPVDVAKNDDDSTAMEQALTQLGEISKSIADLTATDKKEEPGDTETEKAKETPATLFRKALEANGVEGKKLETTMKKYEKVCACGSVKKSEDKPEDKSDKEEGNTDFMGQLSEAVNKARALTPKRLEALKELQTQLAKLVGEMEGIPHSKSPKTKVPKDNDLGASGLKPIMKSLESITAVLKSVTDRVETIEKTRQPSKGLADEGTPTKKVDGDLWNDVL